MFESTYKQIGKESSYTDDEIEMTAELVRTVMKCIEYKVPKTIKITHEGEEFEIYIEKAKELGLIK